MAQDENFSLLLSAFARLVRASKAGLRAAYAFGQVADALHSVGYSYQDLGDVVDRTGARVGDYARLFRAYPTVDALLAASDAMDTFNVTTLASGTVTVRYAYSWQCGNCGSYDVHKHRQEQNAAVRAAASVA